MIAKGWLFSRFMKMNTAVDTFVDKLPSSENGADADCYARGIERLHNAQMVMLDRPTEITRSESEDRSPRDKLRGYSLEQLTGAIEQGGRESGNV
jgi:hypothetical protein